MAIYGTTITVPTITGTHSGYVAQIKTGDLPTAALNSANQVDNGGGNVQIYTDDTKTTRLPIEIVECVTGGTPSFLAYVRMDSASTGADLYFVGDDVQTSQPAVGAAYGRNAVWSDYLAALHLDTNSWVDSTGNGRDGVATGTPTIATTNNPWGGNWAEFSTGVVEYLTLNSSANITDNLDEGLIQCWAYASTKTTSALISNRKTTPSGNFTQLNNRGTANNWQAALHDGTGEATILPSIASNPLFLTMHWDTTDLGLSLNGAAPTTTAMIGDGKLTTSNPYTIGSYFDFSTGRSFDGFIGNVRIAAFKPSDDRVATEYDNQSSSTWFSNDGWNLESGANAVQITESFPALVESISITATTLINSAITEAFPSLTEASSVNISLTVTSAITEIFPSPTESISIVTGGIVTGQITEAFPPLVEATSVNIKSTILSNVTESFPALVEGINITIPGSVVINGKHILRVNAATKTVRINAVSKIKRFK